MQASKRTTNAEERKRAWKQASEPSEKQTHTNTHTHKQAGVQANKHETETGQVLLSERNENSAKTLADITALRFPLTHWPFRSIEPARGQSQHRSE
jgi:hypothetical protein